MKFLALIILLFGNLSAMTKGIWIAVDGGSLEVKIDSSALGDSLWTYIHRTADVQFSNADEYIFQYQANMIEGKRILFINAFCRRIEDFELSKSFLTVKDGGSCFFNVKYDLSSGIFFELIVNGDA
jgi:hypothetical protein